VNKPEADFNSIEKMMMLGVAFRAVMQSLRLGLFDALAAGPLTAEALAGQRGYQPGPVQAVLNLLEIHDLVQRGPDGYQNTAKAREFLESASPFFQGKALEMTSRFGAWVDGDFKALLRGESDMRSRTDDNWNSQDSMDGTAQYSLLGGLQDMADFVSAFPNFQDMRLMGDIGGNHGEYSMALLDRSPGLKGEILDLPNVVPASNERIAARGYAGRLHAVEFDLRAATLETGKYDLLFASHVLYSFVEELPDKFASFYNALRPGGWLATHHLDPDGGAEEIRAGVEFLTRMAGYHTHHIARETLQKAFESAGFEDIVFQSESGCRRGLLAAGRKPLAK
jgi:SAM-dependent methyltransferase